jgi:multiple sugar transport system permease protein
MKESRVKFIAGYTALFLISAMFVIPFIWMVRSSLMSLGQIFQMPPVWIPRPFHWNNFYKALTSLHFGVYFRNTMVIVVLGVLGTVISSTILTSLMLPSAVTLISSFLGWKALGFYDTFIPLIVPAYFGGGIFNVFLLRQFYMTIPRDYDEAAFVDGASYFQIYSRIILPLSRSAVIVVALFSFLAYWNDFFNPLIYLKSDQLFTLALGLQMFQGVYTSQWDLLMAASTAVVLPCVIVFLVGQKYFLEGISLSGIKG